MDENTNRPHAGHETKDVNVRQVVVAGVILVAVTVLSVGILVGVFQFFNSRTEQAKGIDPTRTFPAPQLEEMPARDLEVFHETEQKNLTGYAWVDPQKGIVRIPVD